MKGDRAFQRLRKGRSGGSSHLSLRLRPTRLGHVRVGFVVSRKVGKAVVRNRIRRRLREALRWHLRERAAAGDPASFDLLVVVRPSAAEADYHTLAASLWRALERALAGGERSVPQHPRRARADGDRGGNHLDGTRGTPQGSVA